MSGAGSRAAGTRLSLGLAARGGEAPGSQASGRGGASARGLTGLLTQPGRGRRLVGRPFPKESCRERAAGALRRQHAAFASVPGECKRFQEKFMKCLRDNQFENALCRHESKDYLECRMQRQVGRPGPAPVHRAAAFPEALAAPGPPRPARAGACARELPLGAPCVPPSILSAVLGGRRHCDFRPSEETKAVVRGPPSPRPTALRRAVCNAAGDRRPRAA